MNHILLQASSERITAYYPSDSGNGGTAAMIQGRPGPVLLEGLPEVLQQHSEGPLGAGRPPTQKKCLYFLIGSGKREKQRETNVGMNKTYLEKHLTPKNSRIPKKNRNIWRNQLALTKGCKRKAPPCATTIGVIGVCRIVDNEATRLRKGYVTVLINRPLSMRVQAGCLRKKRGIRIFINPNICTSIRIIINGTIILICTTVEGI